MEQYHSLFIDNYGLISVGNYGTIVGKKGIFKPNNHNSKGYARVHIGKHHYSVHRLVALAWIPNPDSKPQINHKDGNKLNNTMDNLEWVTNKENKLHANLNNLSNSKINCQIANEIRDLYATGKYTYQNLGEIYNIDQSNIGYIIRNQTWNYNTYKAS